MITKVSDMIAEADAIRRVLELAKGNRTLKATAEFHEKRVLSGAARLEDGARMLREKEGGRR